MSLPGRFSRAGMITALVGMIVLGTSVLRGAAQGSTATQDSHVSELSNLEVAVAGDFRISGTELQEYEDGEGEVVTIDSLTALVEVAFYDDPDAPEQTVELLNDAFSSEMDSFEILDEGVDGDRAWSFAQSELDNEEYFLYVDVTLDVVGNVDVIVMLASSPATFFDDLEVAQKDVTVDDEGVFADVDVADLDDIASGGASGTDDDTSGDDSATNADDDSAEEESTTDTDDDSARRGSSRDADDDSGGATKLQTLLRRNPPQRPTMTPRRRMQPMTATITPPRKRMILVPPRTTTAQPLPVTTMIAVVERGFLPTTVPRRQTSSRMKTRLKPEAKVKRVSPVLKMLAWSPTPSTSARSSKSRSSGGISGSLIMEMKSRS